MYINIMYQETETNPYILYNIGKTHQESNIKKQYYLKALDIFENNNYDLLYCDEYININEELADLYLIEEDYEKMEYYFNKSLKFFSTYSSSSLAMYYKEVVKDYKKALEYYLMTLLYDNNSFVKKEILELDMFYETYNFLKENNIRFKEFDDKYYKLINKIKLNSSHKECNVCFDDNINIYIDCSHEICIKCLEKINKCPVCKCSINKDYSFE